MSDWKYEVDEVGDDEPVARSAIEPGDPSLENAAFVLLGVALSVAVILRVVQLA